MVGLAGGDGFFVAEVSVVFGEDHGDSVVVDDVVVVLAGGGVGVAVGAGD